MFGRSKKQKAEKIYTWRPEDHRPSVARVVVGTDGLLTRVKSRQEAIEKFGQNK